MSAQDLPSSFNSLILYPKHKIIVGVDYGTTFTGASYVSSKSNDISDVVIISSWPGPTKNTETIFKTPSRIAYPSENRRIGNQRWGFQVEPGMTAYSWTKLLLDRNTPLTKYDDTKLEDASGMGILRLPEGKNAVDVVSDYLSEVYQHILKTIAKRITEETLSITPLEFWFTMPAIWSDQAQGATRQAAQRAGFGSTPDRPDDKIFMITEPEAAAIAALTMTTKDKLGASVKSGDGVLVCDCGGGTVDITTYLVNNTFPRLEFEELCTGIGGKCGSTAIDRNFYRLMSERFGDDFDSLPLKRRGPGSEFMKKFELIKSDFDPSAEEITQELPLQMDPTDPNPEHYDDEERLVLLSGDDLRSIFEPVVDQVIDLVRQQLNDANAEVGKDTINRIILVGGFGDSEYLRQAFKKSFCSDGKIALTVPEKPQAAIVQGAALRGLQGLRSTMKRCRRHYGFSMGIKFREGIDDERHSFYDDFYEIKMADGIMKWMIAKGEKYSENHTCTVDLSRTYYLDEDRRYTMVLYSCDLKQAPEKKYHKDVIRVGKISMDFTNVNFDMFTHKVIGKRIAYRLAWKLKVVFGAQDGLLKFEAISQGCVIGSTTISFSTAKYY